MISRERVHAALSGQPVDRSPVASLYHFLYRADHFAELTGLPQWRCYEWLWSSSERYLELFEVMQELTPFELLQPDCAPARAGRERVEFVERDGHGWRHDLDSDRWHQLDTPTRSGHASDYNANETQRVFDISDAREQVSIVPAETLIASGQNDYVEAVVSRFGATEFIISGGVVGTPWCCVPYLGMTNLFAMMVENPRLVDYLSQRMLEQNIQTIRCFAAAGGDAIYVDDACVTSDMISVAHYERFAMPHMREIVAEIHRQDLRAILIYYGGIADRLEQIASLGADGLLFECSMKGYVNEVAEIAARIGDRVTIFGNLDPIGVLQDGTDEQLEREVARQLAAGRQARGFIMSTASPITPATPLRRVQRFINLGKGAT